MKLRQKINQTGLKCLWNDNKNRKLFPDPKHADLNVIINQQDPTQTWRGHNTRKREEYACYVDVFTILYKQLQQYNTRHSKRDIILLSFNTLTGILEVFKNSKSASREPSVEAWTQTPLSETLIDFKLCWTIEVTSFCNKMFLL